MPRASPEAMTKPASPRSCASLPANFSPAPEALREPTIAIIGRISASIAPRTPSSGGASSSVASRGGYPASSGATRLTPSLSAGGKFGARIVLAADPSRPRRAAASRQIRQPLQRGARAAEMVDQRAKRARPDIVGADQPQPVDPLGVGESWWRVIACPWGYHDPTRGCDQLVKRGQHDLPRHGGHLSRPLQRPVEGAGPLSPQGIIADDFARRTPAPHRFRRVVAAGRDRTIARGDRRA